MRLRIPTIAALIAVTACAGNDANDDARAAEEEPQQVVMGPHDGRDLPGEDLERIQVGDVAPNFTLDSYDDGLVTLSDFRGSKDVLLVFYRGYW